MGNNFPVFPEQASTFAVQVDDIALVLTLLTVFFTVVVGAMILFLGIKYRRGSSANREGAQSHNLPLEIAWSLPPLVLGLGMFVWSVKPYAEVFNPPPDAEEIFVIGKRWMWHMQHTVNGIRENNELHVPIGRPFKLTIISQDVIHGFYIPDFRLKRDAMPGHFNTAWFQATKPGKYHLFCTEYCGTDHSQMGGWIYVLTPQDYAAWVESKGTTTQPVQSPVQAGFDLFTQLACANCHKEQDSLRAPSLYNLPGRYRNLQNGKTVMADDDYIRKAIREPDDAILQGYAPTMPSYKENLDEQQIHDLIMYIKSLGTGQAAPANRKPQSSATSPTKRVVVGIGTAVSGGTAGAKPTASVTGSSLVETPDAELRQPSPPGAGTTGGGSSTR